MRSLRPYERSVLIMAGLLILLLLWAGCAHTGTACQRADTGVRELREELRGDLTLHARARLNAAENRKRRICFGIKPVRAVVVDTP